MGVVPPEVKQAVENAAGNNKFIGADEFEGDGLTLRVKSFEKFRPKNKKFGVNDEDALYTQKILDEGESFRYVFETVLTDEDQSDPNAFPVERVVESKSLAIFIAFSKLDPEKGDVIRIWKEGKMENTRYYCEKVETK